MPEITYSTRVARPLEDLAEILGHRPADWLAPFASIAAHAGEAAGDRSAGTAPRGPRRSRNIDIDLADGPPDDDFARVDAVIRWHTSGFRWTFPQFEGRIVARPDTAEACSVSLEGRYELPPGADDRGGYEAATIAAETAASMLLSTLRAAVEEQVRTATTSA